ncbi:MAG: hypothetical protein ACFE8L_01185 [Candidatus Hodarchaeota archaeon]
MLSISVLTIYYLIQNYEKYGTKLMQILLILTIINFGVIHSTLFVLSAFIYISELINLMFWKISIISYMTLLIQISLFYSFIKDYKKIPIFPYLIFTIILGLLIGNILSLDSINLELNHNIINYSYSFLFGLHLIVFQIFMILYYFYINIVIFNRAKNKKVTLFLNIAAIFLYIPISMSILYIFFESTVFRNLFIFFAWFAFIFACCIMMKAPKTFMVVTNKLYFVNIYHKSGILLYSYNFLNANSEADSKIWGNILIGLNHILSEFIEKSNHIDVLQTINTEIVVNYDDLGFAVVVATNRKNALLENVINEFTNEFKIKYREELTEIQDLNKLINISNFNETINLIEKYYQNYL